MFDQAKADEICRRLSLGEPLAAICRDLDIGRTTIYDWQRDNLQFAEHIARARVVGWDAIADECIAIAEDGTNDFAEKTDPKTGKSYLAFDSEHVQRSKLRIETRLKLLAKWDPKRYGDKLITENDHKLEVTIRDLSKDSV